MKGYKISEAARATGFTESALRFYEQEGVVVPERTDTGYRSYHEDHLESLRFVARGKRLGLSLEEITELLTLLGEEECEPVQTRIRQLVHDRIAQAQQRISELVGFTSQMQRAAARLGVHTPDGACDDQCGCRTEPGEPVATGHRPIPLTESAAIACSLDSHLVGGRIDDWNRVLANAKTRESIPDGLLIGFDRHADVIELAELAVAEQTCCSFFRFHIGIGSEGVTLEVTGPDDAQEVIASVFGAAA
ncbi:MAG: MerR family transcriptional regulator [Acidimicrobiia bacterium]